MKKKLSRDAHLNSAKTCKELRVSSCELSHLREAGELPYQKIGNAFLYAYDGVQKFKKKKISNK